MTEQRIPSIQCIVIHRGGEIQNIRFQKFGKNMTTRTNRTCAPINILWVVLIFEVFVVETGHVATIENVSLEIRLYDMWWCVQNTYRIVSSQQIGLLPTSFYL
jgi:hypothetical protein